MHIKPILVKNTINTKFMGGIESMQNLKIFKNVFLASIFLLTFFSLDTKVNAQTINERIQAGDELIVLERRYS